MTFWEANLAFEGYRKKEYLEWLRVQRLGYVIAVTNSTKPNKIKPENIVDLSHFEKEFREQEFENNMENLDKSPFSNNKSSEEVVQTESRDEIRARLKAKALEYQAYL